MPEFEILAKVIEISHLEESVENKIMEILNYLKDKLSLCDIHFLLFNEDEKMLKVNYSTNINMMRNQLAMSLNNNILSRSIAERKNVFINDLSLNPNHEEIVSSDKCSALFSLPVYHYDTLLGMIFGEKNGEFTPVDMKLLSLISTEISGMIDSASSIVELNEKIHEISTFFNISKLFNRNEELDELCHRIVKHISTLLYANVALLELFPPGMDDISHKQYKFSKEKIHNTDGSLIRKIIDDVKVSSQPVLIKNAALDHRYKDMSPDFVSAIFVPIEHNSSVIGVLSLIDKETNLFITEKHFSENDCEALISLANQLANFVDNAIMMREKERILKEKEIKSWELGILFDMSKAMMTTMKLDDLLHKILTAVTISRGLGFNRAGLLLVNHRMNIMHGMLGIGPDSGEEAEKIWSDLEKEDKTLLQWMLVNNHKRSEKKSKFDEDIKSIRVSLDEEDEPLINSIIKKKPILITEDDVTRSKYLKKFKSCNYAIVPLISKDKVLGAIYVDNFITKRAIKEEELNFLTLFANQAALAIENSTLYSNLQKTHNDLKETHEKLLHNEKLAALGEMAADVAHEIKNPLMSIGGFANRLNKRFTKDSPEKTYASIIIKEVARLEKILNEILIFSKEERIDNFKCNDINSIINETLIIFDNEFLENNISVITNLQGNLPEVYSDYQQLKQSFINLINNSCQAMLSGGNLTITSRKSLLNNEESVAIEISDTGGGVNDNVLHNIFNPFFTTKDGGTGLGLAITHRLIVNHSGSIEVDNRAGVGATFIINLPAYKKDANKNL